MSVLKVLGTQAGFAKVDFLHFLMDRTALTQKQARVLSDYAADGEQVEFEVLGYNDDDFSKLNEIRVDFEVLR